ncbi:hypothetical protein BDU57DRAFT_523352 [Ampelomyces quisqualis]|uniref:Uncharacterized protein n=1 Tax=Ampelomyces quisqualis TaxID=50730 RepID=A0A6A5QCP7_AMPQU|nr:hypothetical protein BDU57DRAFT_523352 [Ampelomyces quisqualis]
MQEYWPHKPYISRRPRSQRNVITTQPHVPKISSPKGLSYAACKLTYDEDKLVALSSVTRRTHENRKYQYVSRMWWQNLELQFCWFTQYPGQVTT